MTTPVRIALAGTPMKNRIFRNSRLVTTFLRSPLSLSNAAATLVLAALRSVFGDQELREKRGGETDTAGDIEHTLGAQEVHHQRAERHAGDEAGLESEHDDGRALRFLFGRCDGEDVALHADHQHALANPGDRAQRRHLPDVERQCERKNAACRQHQDPTSIIALCATTIAEHAGRNETRAQIPGNRP